MEIKNIKKISFGLIVIIFIVSTIFASGSIKNKPEDKSVMVKLPNGFIVTGDLEEYAISSNNVATVKVNGKEYTTSIENICIVDGAEEFYDGLEEK